MVLFAWIIQHVKIHHFVSHMCINTKATTTLCQVLRGRTWESLHASPSFLLGLQEGTSKGLFHIFLKHRAFSDRPCCLLRATKPQSIVSVAVSSQPCSPHPSLLPVAWSLSCGAEDANASLLTHGGCLGRRLPTCSERCTVLSQTSVIF